MTTPQLPPLPEPYCVHHRYDGSGSTNYFSADQMRAYALAALSTRPVAEGVFAAMPDFLTDTDVARIYRRIYPGSVRWHQEEREFAAEVEALVRARFAELAAPTPPAQPAVPEDVARVNKQMLDALEDLLECPYHIDEATVSKAGLEATMNANPHQVVGNMSVALLRVRKARAAIDAARAAEKGGE